MKENNENWKKKNGKKEEKKSASIQKNQQNQTYQTNQNVQQKDTSTYWQLQITEINSRLEYLDLSDPLDFQKLQKLINTLNSTAEYISMDISQSYNFFKSDKKLLSESWTISTIHARIEILYPQIPIEQLSSTEIQKTLYNVTHKQKRHHLQKTVISIKLHKDLANPT